MFRGKLLASVFLSWALFNVACIRHGGNYLADGQIPVTVEPVVIALKDLTLALPMTLIPSDKADIQFSTDLKIGKVFVQAGDAVNAGAPLFQLDTDDLNIKLAQLKAQRNEQESQVEKDDYFFRNRERLLSEGKIDQSQFNGLEADFNAANATLDRIKNDLSILENQLTQTSFNSPVSGVVTAKNITQGSTAPAKQILVSIVKIDPIYAAFKLSAQDSAAISKGMAVNVKIEELPNEKIDASISYIEPQLDPATKTFAVWATLANTAAVLKAGMTGEVSFTTPQKVRTILVPQESVVEEMSRQFVYTVRNGKAFRVRIFPRKTENGLIEVAEGLTDTDLVVGKGKEKLKDGMTLELWQ